MSMHGEALERSVSRKKKVSVIAWLQKVLEPRKNYRTVVVIVVVVVVLVVVDVVVIVDLRFCIGDRRRSSWASNRK